MDRQIGDKFALKLSKFSKWRAAKAAFAYWAKRMKTRLIELKSAQK